MGIYHRPSKLKDALAVMAAVDARPIAGCTDVFAAIEAQELPGEVLDITGLKELKGITETKDFWRIGAATSWRDIRCFEFPPAFEMLRQAASEIGSVQIQNTGTIGGNICNASPAADGIPPLLALDAIVELRSQQGIREVALADFVTGARCIARQKGELVSAIVIPKGSATGRSCFVKLGARKHLVISISMVAVRLDIENSIILSSAIAIGACGPVAKRAWDLEDTLNGKAIDAAHNLVARSHFDSLLSPISDIRGSADYRAVTVDELVRRSIKLLAGLAD